MAKLAVLETKTRYVGSTSEGVVAGDQRSTGSYAKAHPMQLEVEKSEAERGTYLHPVELGLPQDKKINYEMLRKRRERATLMRRQGHDQKQ
jgi:hypothetical protein